MLTLNDGRNELWQWDTNRKLTVDTECSQVHFSNKVFGRSVDVDVVDGIAVIPDILLQADKDLTAWAFAGTPENGYTKISKVFKVNKRNKPADYVFTIPDQTTLGDILERIEDLENRPGADISEEEIQNAVSDYLEKNPISVEEKDPTVPDWAKQTKKPTYTPEEIGAQPAGDYALRDEIPVVPEMPEIPSALPNPHKLTFTGAVNAEYDGSTPVEVEIPAGGGGDFWELIADITTSEEVSYVKITKDISGNSFKLKKAYVRTLVSSANGTSAANLNLSLLSVPENIYAVGGVGTLPTRSAFYVECMNGVTMAMSACSGNGGQAAVQMNTGNREQIDRVFFDTVKLSSQGSINMKTGASFQVWGVRV